MIMARFHHYNYGRTVNDFQNITNSSRAAEKAAEANRNISELKSEILSVKVMIQAMSEIMIENGVSIDQINTKINEIMERPETFEPFEKLSKPCPKCGRIILDNGTVPLTGTCLYCGTVVRFPPQIEMENDEAEEGGSETAESENTDPGSTF